MNIKDNKKFNEYTEENRQRIASFLEEVINLIEINSSYKIITTINATDFTKRGFTISELRFFIQAINEFLPDKKSLCLNDHRYQDRDSKVMVPGSEIYPKAIFNIGGVPIENIEDDFFIEFRPLGIDMLPILKHLLKELENNGYGGKKKQNTEEKKGFNEEEIILKSHRIKIKGNTICKGDLKPKKVFNPTEKLLMYFLYDEFIKNPEKTFSLKRLSEMVDKKEGTIANSITKINKTIGKTASIDKKIPIIFIKYKKGGYYLDSKYL